MTTAREGCEYSPALGALFSDAFCMLLPSLTRDHVVLCQTMLAHSGRCNKLSSCPVTMTAFDVHVRVHKCDVQVQQQFSSIRALCAIADSPVAFREICTCEVKSEPMLGQYHGLHIATDPGFCLFGVSVITVLRRKVDYGGIYRAITVFSL